MTSRAPLRVSPARAPAATAGPPPVPPWVRPCDGTQSGRSNSPARRRRCDGATVLVDDPVVVYWSERDGPAAATGIPVADAHRGYEQATGSPKRELKIFTEREGGVEHVNLDDPANATGFIADWIA